MFKKVFSTPYVVALLLVFGIASGVATFLESIYDTPTAWKVVYEAWWFEMVMVLLSILMIGIIVKTAMYKKLGLFLFHIAFVLILIAAGITRYYGEEGVIHIREGMSENQMLTTKAYLQVQLDDTIVGKKLSLTQIGDNDFRYKFDFNDSSLIVSYDKYLPKYSNGRDRLIARVNYKGDEELVNIDGGRGWVEPPAEITLKDKTFLMTWGAKLKELPFSIRLIDFNLQRYPGSQSPSSYSSEVVLIDEENNITKEENIYMNHPLVYGEYKFFQSSYDKDEGGTILEVNKDPGKLPTYFGYFLLTIGLIISFFSKDSRFAMLRSFLKNSNLAIFFVLFVFATSIQVHAMEFDSNAYLKKFKINSAGHADAFGKLLIQGFGGRIKPLNTEAVDIVHKITGKGKFAGLEPEQIILGMLVNPKAWRNIEMIKIKDPNIKKYLKISSDKNYLSFKELFGEDGYYRLAKVVDKANQTPDSKRGTFERNLIKLDERLNVAYLTYKGVFFKFVPMPESPNHKWVDLNSAVENPMIDEKTKDLLYNYLDSVDEALVTNSWDNANQYLSKIKKMQHERNSEIMPSQKKVEMEVLYNKLNLFKKLFVFYFILGIVAFTTALVSIFTNRRSKTWEMLILSLFFLAFITHTVTLGMRWYVSGHEPWSDSYESLVYIAWSTILAGLVVFRKSILALATSSLLAGVIMLVAHLSFINPQITNLVPVLKSYWLSIHVSVITASYGFLGLSFMLGFVSLLLMIFKNNKNKEGINEQIRYITAINEISLIIGLAMLSVGNFYGGIWANESWGRYWGWDPKETWALVSIILYTVVVHLRLIPKLNNIYTLSVASVFAFFSILMTYFGVNYYLTGMHSYAAPGTSPTIPSFVYYMIFVIVMVALLAYRKRDVPNIEEIINKNKGNLS